MDLSEGAVKSLITGMGYSGKSLVFSRFEINFEFMSGGETER
jgi:hypothetical protein